jgi:hypothetical protein
MLSEKSSIFSNGLFPNIASKSSLKITSFSIKISANCVSLSLLSSNNLMALWYSFSMIPEISLSITCAVSSD